MSFALAKKQSTDNTQKKQINSGHSNFKNHYPVHHSSPVPFIQCKPSCPCGGGCPRCQEELPVQTKLRIGAPNDRYEQEADRVAEQIMRMPDPQCPECEEEEDKLIQTKPLSEQITPLIQRQVEEEEEEILQAKTKPDRTPILTPDVQKRINAIQGTGKPLPESLRSYFEPRFGFGFSNVRVHTDSKAAETAQAVNARSFIIGRDIVFGTGQYAPGTSMGKRLLAHELTHVLQQKNGYQGPILQRWILKSTEYCLTEGVKQAKSMLKDNKKTDSAYGKWGCKTKEFIDDGKGPKLEIKGKGPQCAFYLPGENLIWILLGIIDCCKDCPKKKKTDVVKAIARTIIHETTHWCAEKHKKSVKGVEEGDDVEKALFGGISILENCVLKTVSSYGSKPCYSCPYVVKKGDSLKKIAERLYADKTKWKDIYDANRKTIGDKPRRIRSGMRLIIPPLKIKR